MSRPLLAGVTAALFLFAAAPANAQIHWDASAQVGVQKRFLGSQPPGGEDAGFGPTAMLNAHFALFPLVRIGGYFGHDISPMDGGIGARDLTWGGVRAKLLSPWPRGTTHAYLFVGFGYDGVYARSSSSRGVVRDGAGGGFFEVPFGLGASYTFWKPWALVAELGMRAGFAHSGSAYEAPGPTIRTPGLAPANGLPSGEDRFGIGLTVGIMLDK